MATAIEQTPYVHLSESYSTALMCRVEERDRQKLRSVTSAALEALAPSQLDKLLSTKGICRATEANSKLACNKVSNSRRTPGIS